MPTLFAVIDTPELSRCQLYRHSGDTRCWHYSGDAVSDEKVVIVATSGFNRVILDIELFFHKVLCHFYLTH